MNFKLEQDLSKPGIVKQVDELKKQVDAIRPLPVDIEGKVMQKLRLEWNYHSNAIEGNRLTYGETVALLMHGITAKGKPLKDHLDIQGHNDAIDYLLAIVKDGRSISQADIRGLHKIILVEPYKVKSETPEGVGSSKIISLGEYKKMPNHVKTVTGVIHYYATPEETPAKMQDLMQWLNAVILAKDVHPIVIAALFHHKFVAIHPFDDGNGRLARILMNLILMRYGYPPVVIKSDREERHSYYALLSQADVGENEPFIEFIAQLMVSSLNIYLRAAKGENIDEADDVDKEIALLKMQLKGGTVAKGVKSEANINDVFVNNILPLSLKLSAKMKDFEEYFSFSQSKIKFGYHHNKIKTSKTETIQNKNLKPYTKLLLNTANKFNFIEVIFVFKGYKNPENIFAVSVGLKITFDAFYFNIYSNQELLSSKLYHENLSDDDNSMIIKNVIKDFQQKINERQKSPKP